MDEKKLKAIARAKETLDKVGETSAAWKPLLADALLDLLATREAITAADVTSWLERELERPSPKLRDIDISIDTRHVALRAAIRHLAAVSAELGAKHE